MTSTVRVELGDRSYPIVIGPGLLDSPRHYEPWLRGRQAVLVASATVSGLHGPGVERALQPSCSRYLRIVVPDGEAQKCWETLDRLHGELIAWGADRRTVLLALGGGVIGDLVGFAAATFQRGVDFIQIPTTLLAQVDSSVGGKTAINHALGKNLIGAFHQPIAVLSDTETLNTLPDRELAAGLAEVIKYGIIHDSAFFAWVEAHLHELLRRDAAALTFAIRRSCEIKAEIVAQDEREHGRRALLNLGHTFGHAIESLTGYGAWLHGEAVAAGTVLASTLAHRMGRLSSDDLGRITRLLEQAGLPVRPPSLPLDGWLTAMGRDKKNEGGRITLILPEGIGAASVNREVPANTLEALLSGH